MSFSIENNKTSKKDSVKKEVSSQVSENGEQQEILQGELDELIDENLLTLKKVHSILINCVRLTLQLVMEHFLQVAVMVLI